MSSMFSVALEVTGMPPVKVEMILVALKAIVNRNVNFHDFGSS